MRRFFSFLPMDSMKFTDRLFAAISDRSILRATKKTFCRNFSLQKVSLPFYRYAPPDVSAAIVDSAFQLLPFDSFILIGLKKLSRPKAVHFSLILSRFSNFTVRVCSPAHFLHSSAAHPKYTDAPCQSGFSPPYPPQTGDFRL